MPLLYLAIAKTAGHLHEGLLTKFPMVMTIKGAVRWLRIGPISGGNAPRIPLASFEITSPIRIIRHVPILR